MTSTCPGPLRLTYPLRASAEPPQPTLYVIVSVSEDSDRLANDASSLFYACMIVSFHCHSVSPSFPFEG